MERYLGMRSHHTVRGRRLCVRRALGTRRTLWHGTKESEPPKKKKGAQKRSRERSEVTAGQETV